MVPAASGCRAMASIAAATDLPSASAGPIEPIETAMTAPIIEMSLGSMYPPLSLLNAADGGSDEDCCEYGEDVGLYEADQDFENHKRNRHKQARERHNEGNNELAAHDIAEEADHQRKSPRHLREDIQRQHDELGFGEAGEITAKAARPHA